MTTAVRGINPIWLFDDLNGNIMDDQYYFFTLQNTFPYLPSPVWHDSSMIEVWDNPIRLLANGTLNPDIFFDPDQVYRLEWRKGDSQSDPLIYLVENYIPDGSGTITPDEISSESDNQITNPQFTTVLFNSSMTITSATETAIAPGWTILTTGAGTLKVSRTAQAGNVWTSTNATNAPYLLNMENSGFSTVTLRQRFSGNGALFTGKSVAMNYTASSLNATTLTGRIAYSDVTGQDILVKTLTTAQTDYKAADTIDASTSSDLPSVGWTDVDFTFTTNTTVSITSIQVVSQDTEADINYIQISPQREIDHEFNYYNLPLQFKPIPSLLTGWDFPLNPAQLGSSGNSTGTAAYILDQTISAAGVSTAYTKNSATGGLQFTTSSTNNAFYILQYLSGAQAKKMLGTELSVNVNAFKSNVGSAVTMRVYLYRAKAASSIPSLGTTIVTLSSSGAVALTGAATADNWTVINRDTLDQASTTLTAITTNSDINSNCDYGFSGWEITNSTEIGDTDKFAIVVSFGYISTSSVITINSVSLVPGAIPTRPAPQTSDEVLRECQYYFQKSFLVNTIPASNVVSGKSESYGFQFVAANTSNWGPVVRFAEPMRVSPDPTTGITLYNPGDAGAQIWNIDRSASWTFTIFQFVTQYGFVTSGIGNGGGLVGDLVGINWTADARLGII